MLQTFNWLYITWEESLARSRFVEIESNGVIGGDGEAGEAAAPNGETSTSKKARGDDGRSAKRGAAGAAALLSPPPLRLPCEMKEFVGVQQSACARSPKLADRTLEEPIGQRSRDVSA